MIYYLLLLLSIILTVCKSSAYNAYAKKITGGIVTTFLFNVTSYGVAAAISLVLMILGNKEISLPTIVCALFYAAIVFTLQTLSITAMRIGFMSTTSICVMYGMIIPSIAGPIFWKEKFTFLQGAGIVLMLISLWFLNGKHQKTDKTVPKKWVLLAALAFLFSGMAGVMEKIHQSTKGKGEQSAFVFLACLCMFVFSVASSIFAEKSGEKVNKKPLILLGTLSGVIVGFYSIVNLTLAGALDSMIYYPVANGGAMLLTVLVSFLVFKEKFNLEKTVGVVVGLLGIVCLSIPV